jgi:hypothetical protein
MEIKIINNMLERKVRQSLMEIKEQKDRNLIKETLVKNRLLVLVEHIKDEDEFNRLSENEKSQLTFNILQELSYLQNSGLLSEQDLGGALKSVFGGFFGNATETFFEPLLGKIVKPLFGEGFMSNFIISYLTKRPSEVIRSMSDCKLMTKLLAESVVEGMVMSLQNQKGFNAPGYSFLRNTLGDAIEGTEFARGIENSLSSSVCGLFSKFTNNAKKVEAKLKTS